MKSQSKSPMIVEVTRGAGVESFHSVDAVVVDHEGKIVEAFGDSESLIFPRSAIKPLQALALVESGALETLDLSEEYLALACSSHQGEEMHTRKVAEWLRRLSLDEVALECGAHRPVHEPTADALIRNGLAPTRLHNNCSGKHCGFLAWSQAKKVAPKGYAQFGHPVQVELRKILGSACKFNFDHAKWGIDGCGIPTYLMPLISLARGMASLLNNSNGKRVLAAMSQYPQMISGTGSFCSEAIAVTKGRWIPKGGAEGVYTAVLPEKGLAIALKARDGATRAARFAAAKLLIEHGGLKDSEKSQLEGHLFPILRNWSGLEVGKLRLRD